VQAERRLEPTVRHDFEGDLMVTAASVTMHDARTPEGLGFRTHFMLQALGTHFEEFHRLGPFRYAPPRRVVGGVKHRWYASRGEVYRLSRDPAAVRSVAGEVARRLRESGADLAISPVNYGSAPLAYAPHDRPRILWTDLTFPRFEEEHRRRGNYLASETSRGGRENERSMLRNTDLAIYASRWAADSAIENYADVIDPERVIVVPFGANQAPTLTSEDVEQAISDRTADTLRLVFIGMEWERKRGQLAVDVVELLNRAGVPSTLDVIGVAPRTETTPHVRIHGYVDRQSPEGRRRVDQLLVAAHFLIVPSASEAFGHVYAEASALGVPSLATDVGGVGSAVRTGVTGKLLPLEEPAETYASYIAETVSDWPRYVELARAAHEDYRRRLNWDAAAAEVVRHASLLL
jgi:glycosyltransferase involved in cell wall biosynthesis